MKWIILERDLPLLKKKKRNRLVRMVISAVLSLCFLFFFIRSQKEVKDFLFLLLSVNCGHFFYIEFESLYWLRIPDRYSIGENGIHWRSGKWEYFAELSRISRITRFNGKGITGPCMLVWFGEFFTVKLVIRADSMVELETQMEATVGTHGINDRISIA
jgi:hypothetical protein